MTNVRQVLIVITDGAQTTTKAYPPLAIASAGVKNKGIAVYAIGVGKGANEAELREIASSQENVFVSASFKELHSLAVEIRKRLCDCKCSWHSLTCLFGLSMSKSCFNTIVNPDRNTIVAH